MAQLDTQKRSKYRSVLDLISWNLNAPTYQLISTHEELHEFVTNMRNLDYNRISIREVKNVGISKYFKMNITLPDFMLEFNNGKIVDHLPVMVSEGLPLEKTSAGCIVISNDDFILESISGTVGVRDITSSRLPIETRIKSNYNSDIWRSTDTHLVNVIEESFIVPLEDYYLEWSVFDILVGVKKQYLLFWEYDLLTREENNTWLIHEVSKEIPMKQMTS